MPRAAHPRRRAPLVPLVPAVLAVLGALVAGCVAGTGAGATTGPTDARPTSAAPSSGLPLDPDTLVIQVRYEGGFVTPDYRFTAMPVASVYADGRIIAPGPQIMIYPGPLLPAVVETTVPAATVERLLADAATAGLSGGVDRSFPPHGIADAPDTVIVVRGPGGLTTTSFGALGMEQQVDDQAEAEARQAAEAFVTSITDPAVVGSAPSGPYRPDAVRLVVRDGAPATDGEPLPQAAVAWPLATPLAAFGTPVLEGSPESGRCGVVRGAELGALWPLLEDANALTPFTSAGRDYQLMVRPLLPHEEPTCG